jgi:hypothetical protein
MKRTLVLEDFAPDPFWISLYMTKIVFSFFLSVQRIDDESCFKWNKRGEEPVGVGGADHDCLYTVFLLSL